MILNGVIAIILDHKDRQIMNCANNRHFSLEACHKVAGWFEDLNIQHVPREADEDVNQLIDKAFSV